jgi:hypothetical protein
MNSDKHHLLQSDDFERAIIESCWFTKTFPRRRAFNRTQAEMVPESQVNLDSCRELIFRVERCYTDAMEGAQREWETDEER